MLIYNYSRTTYELIGEGVEALLDPIGQEPMIPAYATDVPPMSSGPNEIPVYNESANTWSVIADFRGVVYYNSDKVPETITDLGVTIPVDCTTEVPPEINGGYYILSGTSWVLMDIEDMKTIKINECYIATMNVMDENLAGYSKGEMDTWSAMNIECYQYMADGTVGMLMTKKIETDPIYNTADKLANMTITEYSNYLDGKYNLEAQRSQHKLNITNETDVLVLMDYDVSVNL